MPKPHTLPTLYDECKTLSIFDIKRFGFLKSNFWKSGDIKWRRNGQVTGSISIMVKMDSSHPYLELNYKSNDTPISYQVPIVSIPANIP